MATIHASAEANGVLLLSFKGDLGSAAETDRFVSDVDKASKAIGEYHKRDPGKKILILVDITEFQAGPDTRAFDALVNLAKEDKDIVGKTAVFGGTSRIQTLGQTAAYLAGRDNISFFPDRPSAMIWLKGK